MERFLPTWLASSLALAFAALLLGDHMNIADGDATTANRVITVVLVGLVFTLINTFVGPLIKVLSIPFIIITFGLALLVINAGLLLLTEWFAGLLDLEFFVDGFWWAILGSVVISISQSIVRAVVD